MKTLKTLITLFALVAILSGCTPNSNGGNTTEETDLSTAVFLDKEVYANVATFNVNVVNSNDSKLVLFHDGVELESQDLLEGINENIMFDTLIQNTEYQVRIMNTSQQVLGEAKFITGFWDYEIPTIEISGETVNYDQASFNIDFTDENNVLSDMQLVVYQNTDVIERLSIESMSNVYTIDSLKPDTEYRILVISDVDLGSNAFNQITLAESLIETQPAIVNPAVTNVEFEDGTFSSNEYIQGLISFDNDEGAEITAVYLNGIKYENFLESSTSNAIALEVKVYPVMEVTAIEFDNGFEHKKLYIFRNENNFDVVDIELEMDNGVYLINNITELYAVSNDLTASYRLTADLKFPDNQKFTPIGTNTENGFEGTFDGGGFEIANLQFEDSVSFMGLFAKTTNATISNIKVDYNLTQIHIEDVILFGGVVAEAIDTHIENASATGKATIRAYSYGATYVYIGGIVARQTGGVTENCYSEFTPRMFTSLTMNKGGIVGLLIDGVVQNNSVKLEITHGYLVVGYTGGIVGLAKATTPNSTQILDNSSLFEVLSMRQSYTFGGIVGKSETNVLVSGSTVDIEKLSVGSIYSAITLGGVVGQNHGIVEDSVVNLNTGDGSINYGALTIGGVVGTNQTMENDDSRVATVSNSRVDLKINKSNGSSFRIGGIAGFNVDGVIEDSYSNMVFQGTSKQVTIGGVAASQYGATSVIRRTEAVVEIKKVTGVYGVIVGGILGNNEFDSVVEDSKGTIVDGHYDISLTSYARQAQYVIIGGVVGNNSGIISRSIGSAKGTVNNQKNVYLGGIAGMNNSEDVNVANGVIGGLIEDSISLNTDFDVSVYDDMSLFYGYIAGYNYLSETPTVGGLNNTYYSTLNGDFELEYKYTIGEEKEFFEMAQYIKGTQTSDISSEAFYTSLLDISLWDFTGDVPTLKIIESLR